MPVKSNKKDSWSFGTLWYKIGFSACRIVISFNINHTVDAEDEPEIEADANEQAQLGEMKSKPTFEVDIIRGGHTLSFTCSFLQGAPSEGEYSKFIM